MDLQDFRIFSRVAAVQNLTAVGHEMGLTPGTISKRLQALEDHLQVRLFDRSTRCVRITAEGQTFLEHVERILDDVEKARAAIGASAANPKGAIRISVPNWLGRHHIGPAMLEFLHRFPEIEVRVDLTDRVGSLLDDGYDLALRVGDLTDSALIARRLGTLELALSASPDYVARHGIPEVPADLSRHECLIAAETEQWTLGRRSVVAAQLQQVRVAGRYRSNASILLYGAALAGHGILRSSIEWVRDDFSSGRLVPVLPDYAFEEELGVYAVYPGTRHIVPRLRVLVDFLAEWFRDRPKALNPGAAPPPLVVAAE